jgi:hypothetical protein
MFTEYFKQIIQRAKPGLKEGMQDWLDLLWVVFYLFFVFSEFLSPFVYFDTLW